MAYNKQAWKDEIPDLTKPIKDASGKQKTDPQTGRPLFELVQEGTRITSARLNHMEDGIDSGHESIDVLATELATKETPAGAQQKADTSLASAKSYADTQLLAKADKATTYSKDETDQRIQAVVGTAPDALDTLKEIGDALNNDPNFAATVTNQLSGKVDKVAGKQLSTEDYTAAEKAKLAGLSSGAGAAGSATDTVIGNRTITDTEAPTGETGAPTKLWGWLAYMIKSITGKSSWRTAPATTLEAAKTHADDTIRHLTAAERTTWNAAIPSSQKGAAGGVAALDAQSRVVAIGEVLNGAVTRQVLYPEAFTGTAGQKIDIYFSTGLSVQGYIEVTVTSAWGSANGAGKLTKLFDVVLTPSSAAPTWQKARYTEVTGNTPACYAISDVTFDATNSRWRFTIEARVATTNRVSVEVRYQTGNNLPPPTFSASDVYAGLVTLPKPVQVIPDDTETQSGYEIQKHKLTDNDGTATTYGASLDNLVTPGRYYAITATTGKPSGFIYGLCEVDRLTPTVNAYVQQKVTDALSQRVFTRYEIGIGNWAHWVENENVSRKNVSGGYLGIATDGTVIMPGASVRKYDGPIKRAENAVAYRGGVSVTGALKILLPFAWTNTMMRIRVGGYNYTPATGAWEVLLGGYNFSGNPTPGWVNASASTTGAPPFSSVRFAYDGTYCCILLGTLTTVWTYPVVEISEFIGFDNATFETGIGISIITSETGITSVNTPVFNAGTSVETADKIDGFHASVASAANTASVRDSSQYLAAEGFTMGQNGRIVSGNAMAAGAASGGILQQTSDTANGYGLWHCTNCYWDGTNWRQVRGDNPSYAFGVILQRGYVFKYAAAGGANAGIITLVDVAHLTAASSTSATAGNIAVRDSTGKLALVSATRNRMINNQVSATTETLLFSHTPASRCLMTYSISLRTTAAVTVTLRAEYTNPEGTVATSTKLLDAQTLAANTDYSLVPFFAASEQAKAVRLYVTSSVANVLYITGKLEED
ncbi:hypothetical protein GCM10010912_29630 [Paenibacillus albidus]|uniref:Tail fiber protein n=1 Tax=Paenibacillus albidus TaxID=2041023 RepID=A0A917FGA6_9BACL|nr:hypothetical protein [Paenibacillus albidus]GGF82596.1 hypothetical protein GCM10010912_29630 [Paenibacillus albidus]